MNPWGKKKVDAKIVPDRILAVWTDTILHQSGQKGIRGFGGRVYFYEKDKPDPIEVEGSLAVYAFDAEDESVDSQKPLRKFAFTAEHLASHMSKTSIGPSYSIWLPWSAVGEEPIKLSLITRFEGVEGGTTISDPVIKLLPGIAKKTDAQTGKGKAVAPQTEQGVVQASFTEPKGANSDKKDATRPVETIELPPGFQRHFKNSDKSETTLGSSASDMTTKVFDNRSKQTKRDTMEMQSNETESDSTDQKSGTEFASQKADRRNLREGKWIQPSSRLEDRMRNK
jgi:hypothetical protein